MGLMGKILEEPLWLIVWVVWMMIINTLSIVFLKRPEGRWVLVAWVGNSIFMTVLFETVGYVRLLGLSHVLFWTPLVVYLARNLSNVPADDLYGKWLRAVLVTNSLSLVIDYIDVVRYLLGDGAL